MKRIISLIFGALLVSIGATAATVNHVKSVTAIGEVLGDGAKTTAVTIEYDTLISAASLSKTTYSVAGRIVSKVYTSAEATKGKPRREGGMFVIVELETTVSLAPDFGPDNKKPADSKRQEPQGQSPAGAITAGSQPTRKADPFPITATITQTKDIKTLSGQTYKAGTTAKSTTSRVLIAEDFRQLTYKDSHTGVELRYNLFVPKDYDSSQRYPMVLFMHDASGANQVDNYTLLQGNGATVWASPAEQAKHPCFVVAPQYDEIVVDDNFRATASAEATIGLIDHLKTEYSIDANRVYTTGQSMGCMMSYLLMSTHPDEFAAGYLVAGQWNPAVIAPMAKKPLWLVSCTGDAKSSAGAIAALNLWSSLGAKTDSASWPLDTTATARALEISALRSSPATIRYSHLRGGWHNATWRVAYTFAGIRDWLFEQKKPQ